jgi:hypothetical protein
MLPLLLNIGLCCEYMTARLGFAAGPPCLALRVILHPIAHPEIMS